MDTTFYVHTSVLQYYDTNIVFFLSDENIHPTKLRPAVPMVTVSFKLSAYLTIFQWGYLAGFPNFC